MQLRPARPDDATAMAEVMVVVAEEGTIATEPPVDVAARAERFRKMIGADRAWVAEHEGAVVGNAGLHATHVDGVLTFGIALLPGGRGAGRALLRAVAEHARATGAHKLELDVWPGNGAAIALYVSEGFTVEGLREAHHRRSDGSLRSALLMGLRLG